MTRSVANRSAAFAAACSMAFAGALWLNAERATAAQSDACRTREMHRIGPMAQGHDWSQANGLIAIAKRDDNQIQQIHVMKPDGSDDRCLTCTQQPGGPSVGVHKGVPHWTPNGEYIFLQVEEESHPGKRTMSQPGAGRFNDIWVTTRDGSKWWRLTDGSKNREHGLLFPVPSHSGRQLMWSQRYAGPKQPFRTLAALAHGKTTKDMWGHWQLHIADVNWDGGTPTLTNIKTFEHSNGTFYEPQAWAPGDQTIYVASDVGRSSPYVLDVFKMDVRTGKMTNLTNTDDQWEEHLSVSPSGDKLVMMSSECCKWNPDDVRTLAAELYLMNNDGSNKRQLTFFNTPGSQYYSSEHRSIAARSVWSKDGRQIAFARSILGGNINLDYRPVELWMLTFEGACGG